MIPTASDLSGEVLEAHPSGFEITFFMSNIAGVASVVRDDDESTTANLNGTPIPEGTSVPDIYGAVFGHEIGHANIRNLLLVYNNGDFEKEPTKISDKIIRQAQDE